MGKRTRQAQVNGTRGSGVRTKEKEEEVSTRLSLDEDAVKGFALP